MWKLKPGSAEFQVTREGEFEYVTFKHGIGYDRIPEEEASKFEATGKISEVDEGGDF